MDLWVEGDGLTSPFKLASQTLFAKWFPIDVMAATSSDLRHTTVGHYNEWMNMNTHLTALCPDHPGEPVPERKTWILLKQETVSGSGISWAICTSAPRSRQITMPAPQARCPSCHPTNSVKALKANSRTLQVTAICVRSLRYGLIVK